MAQAVQDDYPFIPLDGNPSWQEIICNAHGYWTFAKAAAECTDMACIDDAYEVYKSTRGDCTA